MALPLIHVNARDRERERVSKGDFDAVLLFEVRFQKLYIMQNIQFCVFASHIFDFFFPFVYFFYHQNEINLVDKFKSFLFRFILFWFFVHLYMDFHMIRCLSQSLGERGCLVKYFFKRFHKNWWFNCFRKIEFTLDFHCLFV